MSLPSPAEVEHADWGALQHLCESFGLNPKGRSDVVRMRVLDYVRRRARPEPWRAGVGHRAALLTRLGFPDLAEALWESTIQLDAPAPWVGLGQAQLAAGFLNEAAKSFAHAAQMGDSSASLHRAEALVAGGDYDGAIQACETYLATHPGDVRALAMKADFFVRSGFAEESARVLETAAESHREVFSLSRTVGTVLLRANRPEPAIDRFRDAIRSDSNDIVAWTNRGAALLLAGRTREAIGVLREALKVDPHSGEALNNLGVAYLRLGETKSAAVNLERAARHLEFPRILLNLAEIRGLARDRDDALRAVDQVLRMRPKDPEALAARKRLVSGSPATGVERSAQPSSTRSTPKKRKVAGRKTRPTTARKRAPRKRRQR